MRHGRVLRSAGLALGATLLGAGVVAAADLVAGEWSPFDGGPDTTCADGSEPMFLERRADATKVVLYFEGGGACFNPETCVFDGPDKTYTSSSDFVPALLTDRGGIFDEENPQNPLAEYSFVYAPYCTGDVHLGTRAHRYAPDVVVEHKGFVNATAALDHLVASYPDATDVVVTGTSAGSVPTPLFGALVADRLPAARVVTLGDSSGAYPDDPLLNRVVGSLWGTRGAIPDWPETAGLALEDWGMSRLYAYAAEHAPDVSYARFDYAHDAAQAFYTELAGLAADDMITLIETNEARGEAGGVEIASYVAPGELHTILDRDAFYELEVDGVRFRDWFAGLVAGEAPEDVRCSDCDAPGTR